MLESASSRATSPKSTRRSDTFRCDSFSLVCRIDSVRLKPCLMMSTLAVSTYLESPEFPFDVALFDEASQVLPWDAIGAVYRGRQLVVAGDQKQLPPSVFFDRMVNNDDAAEADGWRE